jgi:general secretion pathway protein D
VPTPGATLPPSAPVPGLTPSPTPARPTPARAAANDLRPVQFINTDVKDVLAFYEGLTGRRMLYSNQLTGNVYIFVKDPVPVSEAIKIIEMSLAMHNIFIEPSEDPMIMRVTGIGQSPKSVLIPFIDNEQALATLPVVTEQIVMYLFRLKFADPTEVAQILTQGMLSMGQGGYASAIPLPKANAVLVTENTAFIRQIIRFLKTVDVEPAEVVSKFMTLQHAQAEDVVASLEKVFEKTQQQLQSGAPVAVQPRTGRGGQGQPGQPDPGNAIGGAPVASETVSIEISGGMGIGPNEESIIVGKVKIAADKRTNRIHIVTRPVNLKFIETLIKEYDADVPLPEPAVRALRYRSVTEVIDAVVAAIRDPGERDAAGATGAGGALGQGQRPGQPTNQNAFNTNQNRNTNTQAGGGGAFGDSTAGALGESLSTSEIVTTPIAQTVGKSTIIADPYSNTIVVIGTSDVKEKVLKLLDQLDSRQAMVMIQVVIGELRLTKDEQFGLDYIIKNGPALNATNNPIGTGTGGTASTGIVGFNDLGSPVLNLNSLINQEAISKIATAGGSGFSGFFSSGAAFDVVLNMLESTNRFRVITTPRVFTTNNKRAIITSGEEVPVPTNIQSSFNTGNQVVSNSSIQFKPIELRLEVLPLINSDKEVSLEIVQNISERAGSTTIDGNAIPNVSRRAIKTYVTVPNQGTLILGGLIKESVDRTRSGVNFLVNVPLIGPLFGNTTKNKTRSELIVMMRPVVAIAPAETAALREKVFESFAIPPDFDHALDPVGMRAKAVRPRVILPTPRSTPPALRIEVTPTKNPTRRR